MKRFLSLSTLGLMALLSFASGPSMAARKAVADLSQDFVAVSEGFDGAHLTVFGVLKSRADVVIVIEGPEATAKVRKKARHMGVWINDEPTVIDHVPGFYAVLSTKPVEKIVGDSVATKYGLGLNALPFADAEAGKGLIETLRAKGLYLEDAESVQTRENNLFRADIDLPASVPIGSYKTRIYEFSGGALVAQREEPMRVAQVGMGARFADMAREKPLVYAVLSLFMSLVVGGGAAFAFRKV